MLSRWRELLCALVLLRGFAWAVAWAFEKVIEEVMPEEI